MKLTCSIFLMLLVMSAACNVNAGSVSDTIRVSVSVRQDCSFNDRDVQFNSYAFVNDGNSTLDGDLSMGCAVNSTLKVDISADGTVIYDETLLDEGFSNQLHIEKEEDGSVKVWQCDSLDDVPAGGSGLGGGRRGSEDIAGSEPVSTTVHVAM